LKEHGETIGINRVHRLMRKSHLKAQVGYRKSGYRASSAHRATLHLLQREFTINQPDRTWVSDITYIRTHEGWLYLAVVIDLFSRRVVGWSMDSRMTKELVLNALLMALWRRNPKDKVTAHSDQGSQYTSHEWSAFLKNYRLEGSMNRRSNCYDNAVAESFFHLLKRERIKRKVYSSRDKARLDVFDYTEVFYNPKCRHGYTNQLSPVAYENQYRKEARMCLWDWWWFRCVVLSRNIPKGVGLGTVLWCSTGVLAEDDGVYGSADVRVMTSCV